MDFKTLYSELQNKIFQPVYLLTGEETFFIDKISQYIEDKLLNEEQKAFDFQIFYGKDSKALDIISALKQYPLVGEKRLVILKEAQQLRDFKTLGTYLKSPLESTVFVICYKGKPIDKRSALYKNLSKSVVFFYSKALYDNQAAIWAKEELQTRGYTISPPALELLLEKTGSKIQYIDNELSKLYINCSKEQPIDVKIIEEQVGILKEYSVFELQNALMKRDAFRCQNIILHFSKNPKNYPLTMTLAALFSWISKLIIANGIQTKNDYEAAKTIGVSPYFVKDYMQAKSHYNLRRSVAILDFIRKADAESKGFGNVSTSQHNILKELIFKIIHI
ncbi:MAG: DNA polymerase III subunit delta [Flavobacteriales bacterium]